MLNPRVRTRFGQATLLVTLGGAVLYAGCSASEAGGAGDLSTTTDGGSEVVDSDGAVGLVDAGVSPDARANYPESILCPDGTTDLRCGPGYSPDQAMSEAELASAITTGLLAWTDPKSTGGACVTCHSPDGIDLARIGYSDCDIRRRALDHVSESQADDVVKLVHALRQKYEIRRPLHPDKFRPFQPNYEPFGQPSDDVEVVDTKSQDARDEAFANYLTQELKLTWATTKIDSLPVAKKAYDELVNLDLHSVKLGIPFDRFSEDPAASTETCERPAGAAHSGHSIFEWIPDIAIGAKSGSEATWNAALSEYRGSPTTENLWKYYDAIDTLTECTHLPAGDYARACRAELLERSTALAPYPAESSGASRV
ncbi:MAG TPA: hypothetical protein VM580_08460, partial [Labilithrix sp.]|nr:hypothetical protein [Labilithrix sp.]